MAGRKRSSTTRLPQALLDEINANEGTGTSNISGRKRTSGVHNRKAERKAERQLAKQRKSQFFSHGHGTARPNNKRPLSAEAKDDGTRRKKAKLDLLRPSGHEKPKSKNLAKEKSPESSKKIKVLNPKERGTKSSSTTKSKEISISAKKQSRIEEEEDAYIEMLEKKLGVKKDKKGKSKYGSGFDDDGLLDLLVDIDEKILFQESNDTEEGVDVDRTFEDSEDADGSSEPDEHESSNQDQDNDDPLEVEEVWTESTSEESGAEDDAEVTEKSVNEEVNGQSSGTKYIPPHLRRQEGNQSEVDVKLIRQLKGLLNRLSEQNIDSILKEIENLYRSYKRHDITETLTNLIIEGTCSHSILLDSYVALHAGLVACLHKIIGVELAAYFVQRVVSNFERHYQKSKESLASHAHGNTEAKDEDIGKECSNLLVLLSELYNYHVISCTLMYDVIRLILEGDLSELDVELILKLARGSGAQLRQDDPFALKDIIQIVQLKTGDQQNISSRTRFMVETLVNLKNNKLKKSSAGAGAQGGGESKERISKFVSGIGKKHHVHAYEPLQISLKDLHQANTKGKWWLVGAAWGGDPLVEQQQASATQSPVTSTENDTLLKLARKQGMNNDVRRSVFVVLMSSDDYVDACDRLAQLNLSEVQQREIIRVLLHCCGNEKSYNPYYTLVACHISRQSHSHRVTLQYCFWDFLRNVGETNVGGSEMVKSFGDDQDHDNGEEGEGFLLDRVSSTRTANVARFYSWLVAKDCVAISILKTLDFLNLKNKTKTFLKVFFTHLFANSQDSSSVPSLSSTIDASVLKRRDEKALTDVLIKALRVPTLPLGILHFLSKNFLLSADTRDPQDEFIKWCCEVAKEVLQNSLL